MAGSGTNLTEKKKYFPGERKDFGNDKNLKDNNYMGKLFNEIQFTTNESLYMGNAIVIFGYREIGNKFSGEFNGSKGYLSNIVISCEGYQKEDNITWIEQLTNKKGSLKWKMANVYYSEEMVFVSFDLDTGSDIADRNGNWVSFFETQISFPAIYLSTCNSFDTI